MKKLKIGVFGVGRGVNFAKNFMLLDCEVVALCDSNEERRLDGIKRLGSDVAVYEDFDSFIEHDMDAVILANYFHEHASFAIRCFEKGLHVFSECISNSTMAEGVELIKAFEKHNSIYFLGENYPQMIFNREMQRVVKSGTLGKILYAEGEYNHPTSANNDEFRQRFNYYEKHWRNFTPRTYYITHSLGPIMLATGATPKKVTAFSSFAPTMEAVPIANHCGDMASIITTQNDDGSIFRVVGCSKFGGIHNAYRICGTNGQIENLRGMGNKIMLRYNSWNIPEGAQEINCYDPQWNDKDEELIKTSGHGGADFITARMFVDCIREKKQPSHPFDIYSAVTMSSVAILAHRSVLEGGKPFDIPDFRNESDCKLYENDHQSPFYYTDGREPNIPCCSHPDYKPTEEQLELYRKALGL